MREKKGVIKSINGIMKGKLDTKRGYFPGVLITTICPDCKEDNFFDGRTDYIYYPEVDKPQDVSMYCHYCECEYHITVVIKLTVSVERYHD
jgi:hypothetical protein